MISPTLVHRLGSLAATDSLAGVTHSLSLQKRFVEAWPAFGKASNGYPVLGGFPKTELKKRLERFDEMQEEMEKMGITRLQEFASSVDKGATISKLELKTHAIDQILSKNSVQTI
ncbi:hypothetical protein K449DRAFT_432615 [Hypoxylon sp. EC38]|nr:hypothetical protein K449DRAFT_432615 [Hypoxylon sp. EC38]